MEIRFAVGGKNQPASSIWKLWNIKSDVYLLQRSMGKVQKFSFHASGICRWAQNKFSDDVADRVQMRWERNPIPLADSGQGSKLIELIFPTNHLSAPKVQNEPINWISPAPQEHAIAVEVVLTNESPQAVRDALAVRNERKILDLDVLSDGVCLFVSYFERFCGPVSLKVPDVPNLPGKVFGELNVGKTKSAFGLRFNAFLGRLS